MIRNAGQIPPRQRRWLYLTAAMLAVGGVLVAFSDRPIALRVVPILSSLFCATAIFLILRQDRNDR